MKIAEMLKCINSRTIMIILILFSMPILGYLHEAKAYTGVAEAGSGTGIITCPTGEQHEGPIAFEATSTATSTTGDFDISSLTAQGPSGPEVVESGVFGYVNIADSGEFKLEGKVTRDDICGSLGNVSSIRIQITGQCVTGNERTTVHFKAFNGETADFPASPTCS